MGSAHIQLNATVVLWLIVTCLLTGYKVYQILCLQLVSLTLSQLHFKISTFYPRNFKMWRSCHMAPLDFTDPVVFNKFPTSGRCIFRITAAKTKNTEIIHVRFAVPLSLSLSLCVKQTMRPSGSSNQTSQFWFVFLVKGLPYLGWVALRGYHQLK